MRSHTCVLLFVTAIGCASGSSGEPDASGGDRPDSAPGSPDAEELHQDGAPIDAMGFIDAEPVDAEVPDATPCVNTNQQLLVNGNFDAAPMGVNWTQLPQDASFPPVDNALTVGEHTAPNGVWLGGLYSSTDALYQTIAIPAGTTALSFTGQKWFTTSETIANGDVIRVQIRNAADQVQETVVTWSNADTNAAWTSFTVNTTGTYAGQTIRLYLQSVTNADPTPGNPTDSAGNTNFFLDSFALNATVCQ